MHNTCLVFFLLSIAPGFQSAELAVIQQREILADRVSINEFVSKKNYASVGADLQPATLVTPAISAIEKWLAIPDVERPKDAEVLTTPLTREEAKRVSELLFGDRQRQLQNERKTEVENKAIEIGNKKLKWLEKTFGNAPAGERSLWISMHGGGSAPAAVNDQQWHNQIKLYSPTEGIYLAPRAPTDAWDMWHDKELDPLLDRLIEDFVALRGVNPNKVYLLGYSAGGDGVWKLAPRLADRFAAAAMMAGHPNGAPLTPLLNLPFAIFMGGKDAAFKRNEIAAERAAELERLAKTNPGSYIHMSRIYPGLPHWMNGKDAEALPWMAKYVRQSWPKKVIWIQDNCLHKRFYWLEIPDVKLAKNGQTIEAEVLDNAIRLSGDIPEKFNLALSDDLLDLNKPITVTVFEKPPLTQSITRNAAAILRSLTLRLDLSLTATAWVTLP